MRIVKEINLDAVTIIVETANYRITYCASDDPVPFTLWTKNPNNVWVKDSQHKNESSAKLDASQMGLA